jgi:hypothetical protein
MLRIFDHAEQLPTKEEFTFREVITGLDLEKSILEQKEVMLSYIEDGIKKSVPAKHDIIVLFKIENEYFVLGLPIENPISDNPIELKTSIGGLNKANYSVPVSVSLNRDMVADTHGKLSLPEFDISPYYVCSRQPNWGEWSVCFVEIVSLSKNITSLEELKKKVTSINEGSNLSYGIYKLDNVILAAKKTAGLPEGSSKEKTELRNYLNDKSEHMVIFNDNDMAKLFSNLKPDQLFIDNPKESNINSLRKV